MTLAGNFRHALIREYVLACGLRCASRRACTAILKSGPGNCIVLTVGGAAESLLIEPGGWQRAAAPGPGSGSCPALGRAALAPPACADRLAPAP
jgi:hypothetical protein